MIDAFYTKYNGIFNWHNSIIEAAKRDKRLTIPSGRFFPYAPMFFRGEFTWPITTIKNYPIQGFGADLVMLARIECQRLLLELDLPNVDLVCTVHDSIVIDTPSKNLDVVARLLLQSVNSVPRLCKEAWDCDFDLPLSAEVQYGKNKCEMINYSFDTVA